MPHTPNPSPHQPHSAFLRGLSTKHLSGRASALGRGGGGWGGRSDRRCGGVVGRSDRRWGGRGFGVVVLGLGAVVRVPVMALCGPVRRYRAVVGVVVPEAGRAGVVGVVTGVVDWRYGWDGNRGRGWAPSTGLVKRWSGWLRRVYASCSMRVWTPLTLSSRQPYPHTVPTFPCTDRNWQAQKPRSQIKRFPMD
jgi:hypothetical protein